MITRRPLSYWVFHRHRLFQLLLFFIIMTSVLFRVVPLEMQKRIVNTAIQFQRRDLLFLYCGLYFAALILSSLLKYAGNFLQRKLGQKILVEIRRELYAHILQLPLGFFRRTPPGTVITAMTAELNSVGHFIGGALAVPVTSAFTLLAFAGYMIHLDPVLGLISISIYPFELIAIPWLQNRYNRINMERIQVIRAMSNVIGDAISGIHEIQGNAGYRLEGEKIDRHIRNLFLLMNRLFRIRYGIKFINNLFQGFGPFLLFLIGGYLAIQGRFTLGALVAFLSAYEKVYDPWKELIEYYQEYQDAGVRYHRTMSYFNETPEFFIAPTDRNTYRLSGRIEVEDLSYTVDEGATLLSDISLQASAGEHIALVGFSGSGKSTLALLLGQLYRYRLGRIRLDDHELNRLTKQDVSRNIGFVAQHPFIFDGALRENLLYGCRSLQDRDPEESPALPGRKDLIEMLRRVGMAEDVTRFGLDRVVAPEHHPDLMKKVFEMRLSVHGSLVENHPRLVEFFDVDRFLNHVNIYTNLLFGDIRDPKYRLEGLPDRRRFMRILKETDLYHPLVRLGWELAEETIHLLEEIRDDAFFYEGSPMNPEEFDLYSDMVHRFDPDSLRQDRKAAGRAMILALRYIPARHKMGRITADTREKVLAARHRFLKDIARLDPAFCRGVNLEFRTGEASDSEMPPPPENPDFFLYCPLSYLHSRSLLENIVFGTLRPDESAEMDELRNLVIRLLTEAGFLNEIIDIGLDFEAGHRGDRLSGGQRQKIAIARALLKETPILILDEATSSLDNASQALIHRYIHTELKGGRTVLSVLHRLDMTPEYDKILVLKGGRIAETGTYQELMDKKGIFHELVRGKG